jgi:hypothetical protein
MKIAMAVPTTDIQRDQLVDEDVKKKTKTHKRKSSQR